MSTTALRILKQPEPRISEDLLARFANIGCAQISDCMNRLYGVVGLKPYHDVASAARTIGIAFTVKTRPGDNLLIHHAIDLARPGDVIVVDGGGETNNALVGELMAMDAEIRGIAGFVIDGAIRDEDVFAKQASFGCFARSVSHRGPYKDGPGEINVPVSIGGQVVFPGDIIIGDADGVLAIPAAQAEEILALAEKKEAAEVVSKSEIKKKAYSKAWLKKGLERVGIKA